MNPHIGVACRCCRSPRNSRYSWREQRKHSGRPRNHRTALRGLPQAAIDRKLQAQRIHAVAFGRYTASHCENGKRAIGPVVSAHGPTRSPRAKGRRLAHRRRIRRRRWWRWRWRRGRVEYWRSSGFQRSHLFGVGGGLATLVGTEKKVHETPAIIVIRSSACCFGPGTSRPRARARARVRARARARVGVRVVKVESRRVPRDVSCIERTSCFSCLSASSLHRDSDPPLPRAVLTA